MSIKLLPDLDTQKRIADATEGISSKLESFLALVDTEIFIVVGTLPGSGLANKIYLVPKTSPDLNDGYDGYIWKDNDWELLGNLKLDLSDYHNKDIAVSNILNANPNIVFENEVIYDRRVRGWKEIGEVPIYLRKDEIGTNRIQGSAIVGDEIFWIGGTTVTSATSSGLQGASNKNISYNLKTNVWKENLDLPVRKDSPTLVAVGTDIYILGSYGRTNKFPPFDSVFTPDYKYDTITNTYEEISSLQDENYLYVSVQSSGADHLDGKIYISGRYWDVKEKSTGSGSVLTEPRLAIYDIAADTWTLGATPPMSNDGGSSKILDRKFYVYRNTLHAYDIDNDTWSEPLNVSGIESRSHTSMAKRDGKLYNIGGYISGSSPAITSGKTYVYDPILNEWEEDVDLLLNNAYGIGIGYAMAVVWNDRLVVFGGTGFDENKYSSGSKIEDQFRNFNVYIEDYRLEKDLTPIYEKSNRELNEHIEDLNNPHGVTAEQVDTYNKTTIDNKDAVVLQEARGIYWQGNTSAHLGDIITDMLGQPKNSLRPNYAEHGVDLCSVYELTVNAYDDLYPYQGKTLIYVPNDTTKRIEFFLVLAVGPDTSLLVEWGTDLTVVIPDASTFGYQVLLKLVVTNQLKQHSYS